MSAGRGAGPGPGTERRVGDWLAHGPEELPDHVLQDVLQLTAVTPQARRRLLGRWLHRDEGVGRAADEPDGPSSVGGRSQLLLSLAAVTAAIALLVSAFGVFDARPTPPVAAGPGLIVAADGTGHFLTVQAAVAVAEPGDIVVVQPGRYEGPVSIDKDLSLVGDGARASVVITAPTSTETLGWQSPEVERPQALLLAGATVIVSDLTIETPTGSTGIEATAGSPLIERVSIVGAGPDRGSEVEDAYSMGFYGQTTPVVRASEWDGYVAVRDGASATFEGNTVSRGGLSIDGPGASSVTGNVFVDGAWVNTTAAVSMVTGNTFAGGDVSADSGSDIEVRDNTFRGPLTAGWEAAIRLGDGATQAIIVGNVVEDAAYGVRIERDASAELARNELATTVLAILVVSSGDVVIDGNTIAGEGVGISVVSPATAPTIAGNTVDVTGRAISVAKGTSPVISGNDLCGADGSIQVSEGATPEIGQNRLCGEASGS